MKNLVFIICFFALFKTSLYPETTNSLVNDKNNNGLYSFPELYEKTIESTVWIKAYYDSKLDDQYSSLYWLWYGDTFYEDSQGTGFVYSNEGYIVTNYHIIKGCNYFEICFSDETSCNAKLIGFDDKTDIAVLKINKENLTPLILEEEEAKIGQWVYTIGHPVFLEYSLSVGVISRKNVPSDLYEIENLIQLDMNINHGNSGGPVLTLNGKVIGIASYNFHPSYATGICFVIPNSVMKKVVDQLIKN